MSVSPKLASLLCPISGTSISVVLISFIDKKGDGAILPVEEQPFKRINNIKAGIKRYIGHSLTGETRIKIHSLAYQV